MTGGCCAFVLLLLLFSMACGEEASEMSKKCIPSARQYVLCLRFPFRCSLCRCIWPWRVLVDSEHTKSELDDLPELLLRQREVDKKVSLLTQMHIHIQMAG